MAKNNNNAGTGSGASTGTGTTVGDVGKKVLTGFEIYEFIKTVFFGKLLPVPEGKIHLGEAVVRHGGAKLNDFLRELATLDPKDQHRLMKHHIHREDAQGIGENVAKMNKDQLKTFITSHCTTSMGRDIDEVKTFIKTEYPKIKIAQEATLLSLQGKKHKVPSGFKGLFKLW